MTPKNFIDMKGKRFGRLTVVRREGTDRYEQATWLCACDCGKSSIVVGSVLRNGKSKSCGCLNREINANLRRTHGRSKTKLYLIWNGMIQRCTNPNTNRYRRYGERGIKVCREWMTSFVNFMNWAIPNGYSEGLSIDRINNNSNYSPKNCRWVTRAENSSKGCR